MDAASIYGLDWWNLDGVLCTKYGYKKLIILPTTLKHWYQLSSVLQEKTMARMLERYEDLVAK